MHAHSGRKKNQIYFEWRLFSQGRPRILTRDLFAVADLLVEILSPTDSAFASHLNTGPQRCH